MKKLFNLYDNTILVKIKCRNCKTERKVYTDTWMKRLMNCTNCSQKDFERIPACIEFVN